MPVKAIASVLFGGIFGMVFIVIGIRRILQARNGEKVIDSVFWGTVGIVLGLGFFYGAYWLMTPPPESPADRPFDMHSAP
jgi:uncharacterized membrane protein YjfL (UPF0719 family)